MRLNKLLQELAITELKGSPCVAQGSFEIQHQYLPTVIVNINKALEAFYSQFALKESTVLVRVIPGIREYVIHSDYAQSTGDNGFPKYIMDSQVSPFEDDLLQILDVQMFYGGSIGYNNPNDPYSICPIGFNRILVPDATMYHNQILSVYYQAGHKEINPIEPDMNMEVELPQAMNTAFQAYIASLVYHSLGGTKHEEANMYYGKYMAQLQMLTNSGIGVKSFSGNIKPALGDWK